MKAFITLLLLLVSSQTMAAEIEVLSAGVGEEDRQEHAEYSLKLVFFEKGGPYLADVNVVVFDQNAQQIFEGVAAGPWLFMMLPGGEYSVRATRKNGDVQSVRFSVTADQQITVHLAF